MSAKKRPRNTSKSPHNASKSPHNTPKSPHNTPKRPRNAAASSESQQLAVDDATDTRIIVTMQHDPQSSTRVPAGKRFTDDQRYFAEGMNPDGSRFTLVSALSRFIGKAVPGSMGRDRDLKKDVMFVELCDFQTGYDRCITDTDKRQYHMVINYGDEIMTIKHWNVTIDNCKDPVEASTVPRLPTLSNHICQGCSFLKEQLVRGNTLALSEIIEMKNRISKLEQVIG